MKTRVLLTFSGAKPYVVHALRGSALCGHVVAADADPAALVRFAADAFEVVPPVDRAGEYVDALVAACRGHAVDCVIPLNDRDLSILAAHRERFEAAGARVLTGAPDAVELCSDKLAMAEWLGRSGFDTLATVPIAEAHRLPPPLVLKERRGQGSAGFRVVRSAADLGPAAGSSLVAQPLLAGREWAVDVLRSERGVCCALAHEKLAISGGDMAASRPSGHAPPIEVACRVADALGIVGNLDIDVMEAEGALHVLDVNPRLGGTFGFTRAALPAYVDLLLEVARGGCPPRLELRGIPLPPVLYKCLDHRPAGSA